MNFARFIGIGIHLIPHEQNFGERRGRIQCKIMRKISSVGHEIVERNVENNKKK